MLIDLRTRVFLHTQKLSLEFHESYTSGRIISRQTSDLDAIRELMDEGLTLLVRGLMYMVFTAIALVLLDWQSGLVLLVALVPLGILTRWFQVRSQALFRRSRVASAKLIVQFVETMTGIRAVQAFRKERRNEVEFGDLIEDYRDVNAKVLGLFAVFNPGLALIGNTAVAVDAAARRVPGDRRVARGGRAARRGALHASGSSTRWRTSRCSTTGTSRRRRRSRRSRACSRSGRACPTR